MKKEPSGKVYSVKSFVVKQKVLGFLVEIVRLACQIARVNYRVRLSKSTESCYFKIDDIGLIIRLSAHNARKV